MGMMITRIFEKNEGVAMIGIRMKRKISSQGEEEGIGMEVRILGKIKIRICREIGKEGILGKITMQIREIFSLRIGEELRKAP